MKTDNTRTFAKACKELADYFYNIAPKKEVFERDVFTIAFGQEKITVCDEDKTISLPVPPMPITLDEFKDKAKLFEEELNENILANNDALNTDLLLSAFGKTDNWIAPTRKMFFDVELDNDVELLDWWLYYRDFVKRLLYGYNWITENTEMEEYRKGLLATEPQQAATPEPEQAANPQPQQSAVEAASDKDNLTERESLYYTKVIKHGWAEETESGYRWLFNNRNKASLAYFLDKVFYPDNIKIGGKDNKRLERLWGVKRLDSATYQAMNGNQYWKPIIDELFI